MKFHDLNADGVKDAGDPGLGGWTIYVDYDDSGTLGAGEPSAVTSATDGSYQITGIKPGTYKVREVLKAGWTQSYPGLGYHEETFQSSDVLTDNDFANWYPATKSGTKYEDLDADGVIDAGESGLPGWTMFVDYDDDGVLDAGEPSDVTDVNGDYEITGIVPGTSKVREVLQENWFCSYPSPDCWYEETFQSSDVLTDNDFANYEQADLSVAKTGKITYIVTVTNDGPSTALNVDLDDDLPGNLAWAIVGTVPECSITTLASGYKHLHCDIASMAAAASFPVTVEASINDSCEVPELGNDASADSDIYDPNTANNSDDADICPLNE